MNTVLKESNMATTGVPLHGVLGGAWHAMLEPVRSVVTQREIGRHARDLPSALKACLREDPDVIVIDDLRDFDAISFASRPSGAGSTATLMFGFFAAKFLSR